MFNFLGTFSETQYEALKRWIKDNRGGLPGITEFYRMRANQLRKTGGLLSILNTRKGLEDKFKKELHSFGTKNFFFPLRVADTKPADQMMKIKELFYEAFDNINDLEFQLLLTHVLIEIHEDAAVRVDDGAKEIDSTLANVDSLFGDTAYQTVLIKKADESKYRTDIIQPPTEFESTQYTNSSLLEKETQ